MSIPKFNILPAQKIPKFCQLDEFGNWQLKPEARKIFGDNIFWINEHFLPMWNCTAKFQIYKGGSGSSKSHFIARRLLMKCITQQNCRVLYMRLVFADIKKSCYQLFVDVINKHNLQDYFTCRDSDYEIHCINGNKLIPAGFDNVERLKSVEGITDVWIEEAITKDGKVSDIEFRELVRRVRPFNVQPTFFISFNPVDTDNFVYRMFVEKPLYKPYSSTTYVQNSYIIHTSTYQDNFFVPGAIREEYDLLKEADYQEWLIYAKGEWGNPRSGKEYITSFRREIHAKSEVKFNKNLAVYLFFDFNVNPYITLIITQVEFKDGMKIIRWVDEICLPNPRNTIKEAIKEAKDRGYIAKGLTIYYGCDASGTHKIPGFGSTVSAIKEIRANLVGYVGQYSDLTKYMKKNPDKLIARQAVIDIFAGIKPNSYRKGNIICQVNPKCVNTVKDFAELENGTDGYNPKRVNEDGMTYEKMGHCYSASVYFLYYICNEYFKKSHRIKMTYVSQ